MTAKQEKIQAAFVASPRQPGESKNHFCRRVAEAVGVTPGYVAYHMQVREAEEVGRRAREQRGERLDIEPYFPGCNVGPVQFSNWPECFYKLKLVTEAFLLVARTRNDVWARATLENVRDQCEIGLRRACGR